MLRHQTVIISNENVDFLIENEKIYIRTLEVSGKTIVENVGDADHVYLKLTNPGTYIHRLATKEDRELVLGLKPKTIFILFNELAEPVLSPIKGVPV
jgi:hypothetical protein